MTDMSKTRSGLNKAEIEVMNYVFCLPVRSTVNKTHGVPRM